MSEFDPLANITGEHHNHMETDVDGSPNENPSDLSADVTQVKTEFTPESDVFNDVVSESPFVSVFVGVNNDLSSETLTADVAGPESEARVGEQVVQNTYSDVLDCGLVIKEEFEENAEKEDLESMENFSAQEVNYSADAEYGNESFQSGITAKDENCENEFHIKEECVSPSQSAFNDTDGNYDEFHIKEEYIPPETAVAFNDTDGNYINDLFVKEEYGFRHSDSVDDLPNYIDEMPLSVRIIDDSCWHRAGRRGGSYNDSMYSQMGGSSARSERYERYVSSRISKQAEITRTLSGDTSSETKSHVKVVRQRIRYPCQHCDRLFTSKKLRRHHMSAHTLERIRLKYMQEVNQHQLEHADENEFQKESCAVCATGFETEADCLEHSLSHSNEDAVSSQSARTKCTQQLKSHVRTKYMRHSKTKSTPNQPLKSRKKIATEKRLFCCKCCSARCRGWAEMQQHVDSHIIDLVFDAESVIQQSEGPIEKRSDGKGGLRSIVCPLCSKRFQSKRKLKAHCSSHINDKQYKCRHCSTEFAHKYEHAEHLVDYSFREKTISEKNLSEKTSFKRTNSTQQSKSHKRAKRTQQRFSCKCCSVKCRKWSEIKQHVADHIIDRVSDKKLEQLLGVKSLKRQSFRCPYCFKLYHRNHLRRHITYHFEGKRYMCQNCSSEFDSKHEIAEHLADHPFQKKIFRSSSQKSKRKLISHQRTEQTQLSISTPVQRLKSRENIFIDGRVFYCKCCSAECRGWSQIKQHVGSHIIDLVFDAESVIQQSEGPIEKRSDGKRVLRSIVCPLCSKRFRSIKKLKAHCSSHINDKQYKCRHCSSEFAHKYEHAEHLFDFSFREKTISEKNLSKKTSFKRTNSTQQSKSHKRAKRTQQRFSCKCCSVKCRKWSEIKQHVADHIIDRVSDEKLEQLLGVKSLKSQSFRCPYCFKLYHRNHLRRHITYHFEGKRYMCQNCSSEFDSKHEIAEHLADHPFQKKIFRSSSQKSKRKLISHQRTEQTQPSISTPVQRLKSRENIFIDGRVFYCKCCSAECRGWSQIRQHVGSHIIDRVFDALVQCSDNKWIKNRCPYCVKSLYRQRLEVHITAYHFNGKRYKCQNCPTEFHSKIEFADHLADHPFQEKIFTLCKQTWEMKQLMSHQRTKRAQLVISTSGQPLKAHENIIDERLFYCKCCYATCRGWSEMQQHIASHTIDRILGADSVIKQIAGDTEYRSDGKQIKKSIRCPLCAKSFEGTKQLNRHLIYHIKDNRYRCKNCSTDFIYKRDLTEHLVGHPFQEGTISNELVCSETFDLG